MKKWCFIFVLIFLKQLLLAQTDTAYIYTFGGDLDEQGRDIELTSDSGFIMVGATSSFGHGNSDIYLVKVDSNINYQWSRAIGDYFLDFGHAVKQTSDNGFIICGYSNSGGNGGYDGYLVKTNDTGAVVWTKYFGGFDWDKFYDLEITPDGGFMIVGETHSFGAGGADAWVIKTDSSGNTEWEKTFGGAYTDIAHALIKTSDGNYAFCGENGSESPVNKGDAWLLKFDGNGDVVWESFYDRYNTQEFFNGLIEDGNGNFACVGQIEHPDNNQGINELIIVFNSSGKKLKDNHSLLGSETDVFQGLMENTKGNYITVGFSNTNGAGAGGKSFGIRTIEIDKNLGLEFGPVFGAGEFDQKGYDIVLNHKNERIVIGQIRSLDHSYTDLCLIHFLQDTVSETYHEQVNLNYKEENRASPLGLAEENTNPILTVYPNPTNDFVNIKSNSPVGINKINFLNAQGQVIDSQVIDDFRLEFTIETSSFNRGLYFIDILFNDEMSIRKKIVKN